MHRLVRGVNLKAAATVASTVVLAVVSSMAGCGDSGTAHFGGDTGVGGTAPPPGGTGGTGGTAGTPGGTGGEPPEVDQGQPPTGGADAFIPADVGLGGTDAWPADAAADVGPAPDLGLGGAEPPPAGPLPEFSDVAVATAGDTTYVAWVDGAGLEVRSFGGDFVFDGPAVPLPALGTPRGLAALSVAEIPMLAVGSEDGGPISVIALDAPDLPPVHLEIIGQPIVTQLGGRLLVIGRMPSGEGTAWQLVDPAGGDPTPWQGFDGTPEVPDSAGGIPDAAVIRYPASGQCLFLDASGAAAGAFVCEPGRDAFIASDGLKARLVFVAAQRGTYYHYVVPLLGGGAYEPAAIGVLADSETLGDNPNLFPNDGGTRPSLQVPFEDNPDNLLTLTFAEVDHLFRGTGHEVWPDLGVRAAVRRGDSAVLVRFGYEDVPRLSMEAVTERIYEGAPYALEPLNDSIDPNCLPTLEACDPDLGTARDDDCDGVLANGLCCFDSEGLVHWTGAFTPHSPITKFAMDDVPNRDVYTIATEHADGSVGAYIIDFAANNLGVHDMVRGSYNAQSQRPWVELGDEAHGLVGMALIQSHRGVIAHDADGQLAVWWKGSGDLNVRSDPTGAGRHPAIRWEAPSRLEGCESVLAYDAVARTDPENLGDAPPGWMGMIIVCTDRIFRYSPRKETYLYLEENGTVSTRYGDVDFVLPLTTAAGTPVVAEWATTLRSDQHTLTIVVAYRDEANDLQFLRYLVDPDPEVPGSQRGISRQPIGQGALAGIDPADRVWPIYWSMTNSAYVQLTRDAGFNRARARVPVDMGYTWLDVVLPRDAQQLEVADLNNQLVAGGPANCRTAAGDPAPCDAPGVLSDYGLWVTSLGGLGGVNLWAPAPAHTIDAHADVLWHTTRGPSLLPIEGRVYPGIVALYPDTRPDAPAGQWMADVLGIECVRP